MLLQPKPVTPVIIKVVPPKTPEVSVVDVLFNAFGIVALVTMAAVVVGLVFGALLIGFRRWRERNQPSGTPAGTTLDLSR